jgi:hypothetical protein
MDILGLTKSIGSVCTDTNDPEAFCPFACAWESERSWNPVLPPARRVSWGQTPFRWVAVVKQWDCLLETRKYTFCSSWQTRTSFLPSHNVDKTRKDERRWNQRDVHANGVVLSLCRNSNVIYSIVLSGSRSRKDFESLRKVMNRFWIDLGNCMMDNFR